MSKSYIAARAERAKNLLFTQGACDRAKGVERTSRRDNRYPADHSAGWRTAEDQREWERGWDATNEALAKQMEA